MHWSKTRLHSVHWCRCEGDLAALLKAAAVAEHISLNGSSAGGTTLQALQQLGGSLRTLDIRNVTPRVHDQTSPTHSSNHRWDDVHVA